MFSTIFKLSVYMSFSLPELLNLLQFSANCLVSLKITVMLIFCFLKKQKKKRSFKTKTTSYHFLKLLSIKSNSSQMPTQRFHEKGR